MNEAHLLILMCWSEGKASNSVSLEGSLYTRLVPWFFVAATQGTPLDYLALEARGAGILGPMGL